MEAFLDDLNLSFREKYMVLAGIAGMVALLIGMLGGWLGAYIGGRLAARRAVRKTLAEVRQPSADPRIASLAISVDAMSLEVERIAEAQRFLVRLLSERESDHLHLPPARPSGAVTPH